MGRALALWQAAGARLSDYAPGNPAPTAPLSIWQEHTLSPILWNDLWGVDAAPVTVMDALTVPAIAKGRAILRSLIIGRPLRALRGPDAVDPQPAWLYRSDRGLAPQYRLGLILDDLIFRDASLLLVDRGAVPAGESRGPILDAVHVPYESWSVHEDGTIWVGDEQANEDSVVYIPGPGPGLLAMAGSHIRAALDTEGAWSSRVKYPFPAMILREANDDVRLTSDEAAKYVEAVASARRDPRNAVAFVPYGIEVEAHGAESTDLFESGRNALRLDFANFMNIPAALMEGSMATASLTYSTQEGKRSELFDYTLAYWTNPIEHALSVDSVCPRGQRIRFDWTDLETNPAPPTGALVED